MSTEKRESGGEIDFKALGRHFEARRMALGMRPGELAIAAGLVPAGSRFVSIEGAKLRDFERRGRCDDLSCRTIARAAEVLGIADATVFAVGGLDLATLRDRWAAESAGLTEYERSLDEFLRTEFEKDGRPPPNAMVGPYGWYQRKKDQFALRYREGIGHQDSTGVAGPPAS